MEQQQKQISFRVSEKERRILKSLAAKEGKTIKTLVFEVLKARYSEFAKALAGEFDDHNAG